MRAEDLFEAMGDLDEQLLALSEKEGRRAHKAAAEKSGSGSDQHKDLPNKKNIKNKKKRKKKAEIYRLAVVALTTAAAVFVVLMAKDLLGGGVHSSAQKSAEVYAESEAAAEAPVAEESAVDSVLAAGADESAAKEAAAEMTEETEEAAADMGAADHAAPAAETQNAAPVTEAQKAASDSESVNGAAKASVKDEKIDAVALLGDMRGDYVKLEFISAEEAASGGERRVPEYSKEREEALSSALENGETRVAMFTDTGKPVYYVYLTDSKGDEDKVTFYENGYVGIDTIPGVVMKVPEDTFEAAMEIFR